MLRVPGFQRLKQQYGYPLSSGAFKFNLRPYQLDRLRRLQPLDVQHPVRLHLGGLVAINCSSRSTLPLKRLKLRHDGTLSSFAFTFNSCPYTSGKVVWREKLAFFKRYGLAETARHVITRPLSRDTRVQNALNNVAEGNGPGGYCTLRHRMTFDSRHEGSNVLTEFSEQIMPGPTKRWVSAHIEDADKLVGWCKLKPEKPVLKAHGL